jgi:hypothetical protein
LRIVGCRKLHCTGELVNTFADWCIAPRRATSVFPFKGQFSQGRQPATSSHLCQQCVGGMGTSQAASIVLVPMYDLRTQGRSDQLNIVPSREFDASGLQIVQHAGRRAASWPGRPPQADEQSVYLQNSCQRRGPQRRHHRAVIPCYGRRPLEHLHLWTPCHESIASPARDLRDQVCSSWRSSAFCFVGPVLRCCIAILNL